MNYIKLLFVLMVMNFGTSYAQTIQDVFAKTEVTWYGLDFTKTKFVGDFSNFNSAGRKSGVQIKEKYFREWNAVVDNETEKFDIPKFYDKTKVNYALTQVTEFNAAVNPDDIMVPHGDAKALSREEVEQVVNKYKSNGKSGLGLIFVVESFDKSRELGTMHVTFFDIATNKILLSKRLQTASGGIGLCNYWIRTVIDAMDESKSNWKKWKKEAGLK
jgi:hypothetical protein